MKRNWYLIAGVIAIALLLFLKYDYDQREKEKQRVEQLNNSVMQSSNQLNNNIQSDLNNGYGKSTVDGISNINISGEPN